MTIEFVKDFDIKHRQPTAKNCGLYALANTINEDVFVDRISDFDSDNGHRVFDLNEALRECGFNFHLEVVYADKIEQVLPVGFEPYPTDESQIMPCIITTASVKDGMWHCVGIRTYGDKTISIFDSLRHQTIVTTWDKIHEIYSFIDEVHFFSYNDNSIKGFVCLE